MNKITVHGSSNYSINDNKFFRMISNEPVGTDAVITITLNGMRKSLMAWYNFYKNYPTKKWQSLTNKIGRA